jgi:hypothetical protein
VTEGAIGHRRSPGSLAARWAPWGIALVTLLILLPSPPMPVGVFYDDGIYVDLAKALASGAGYHHLALPGTPAGVHYPPLYPVWLVLWSWIRPPFDAIGVIAWLKMGNALLAALSVVPWARWGARRLGLPWFVAAPAAAVAVLLVPSRAVTSTLFSEPLSWLLLGLAFELSDDADDAPPASAGLALAAATVAALLPLARTIFLPVTLAVAWRLATERGKPVALRQREATLAAFMLLPTLAWMAWSRQHAHEIPAPWIGSYGTYGGMWRESVSGAGDLFTLVGEQLSGVWRIARQVWGLAGVVPAMLLCAFGLWRLRGWRSVSLLGAAGYFAALLVWPMPPDRFLWGVLPLITLLLLAPLVALRDWPSVRGAGRSALVLLMLGLPLTRCEQVNARGYAARGWIVPQAAEADAYAPVVRWAKTLPAGSLVLSANDPLVAQGAGVHAAPLLSPDLREMRGATPTRSPSLRVKLSACAAGSGWMVVIDTLDLAGSAIAELQTSRDPDVRFGDVVRLGGSRAALPFRCVSDSLLLHPH